jgi:hypothetical protein
VVAATGTSIFCRALPPSEQDRTGFTSLARWLVQIEDHSPLRYSTAVGDREPSIWGLCIARPSGLVVPTGET